MLPVLDKVQYIVGLGVIVVYDLVHMVIIPPYKAIRQLYVFNSNCFMLCIVRIQQCNEKLCQDTALYYML